MIHRERRRLGWALLAAALRAGPAGRAAGTQYDVVVLNPNGGTVSGIYEGVAVGSSPLGVPTVWTNNGTTATPLQLPPGYTPGATSGIFGSQVGGYAFNTRDVVNHALLWNGFNSQPVDLGALSGVIAIYNGVQAGAGNGDVAAIWHGTAASVMSLTPPGATFYSDATGIWGGEVSGRWYINPSGTNPHAAVWTSLSPSGFVDLAQPALYTESNALAISRGQVAGWAGIAATKHASIWTNTAASFTDLAPVGTTASELRGTNGVQQVGDVSFLPGGDGLPADFHAAVWNGTAGSYQLLPLPNDVNNRVAYSIAYAIDGNGDIVGDSYVGGSPTPILWVPHRLPGDANFDGTVSFSDLLILSQHYGQAGEWVDGEFSGGGTVDFADLLILAQNYGKTQAAVGYSVAAVPEPSAVLLVACGMGLIPRRRR